MTSSVVPGDPFGPIRSDKKPIGPSPQEVHQLHNRSDVDASVLSQHHTLGIKHTQAAPGDHVHDGIGSRKIGAGLGITVTGSRGGNAALASLLTALAKVMEFTDSTTA
jgi:hypothetical protein